jgi:hypothetical protein
MTMSKGAVHAASPLLIEDANLSWAWARIVIHIKAHAGRNISPLVVSISGFDERAAPYEDLHLRRELDALLAQHDEWDIETVAFTIFPERIWRIAGGNRKKLFDYYRRAFPRYQAMNRRLNGKGLYFERLTMFGDGPNGGNQLEHIIETYNSWEAVRDTMLQAAIFDPGRDHTKSAQLGFPCLQHVSFVPTRDGLVTNAFYATQQLFEKAYGNYLGLARLCTFMAGELGMKPARLNVYVGVAKLEGIPKTDATLGALLTSAQTRMGAEAA